MLKARFLSLSHTSERSRASLIRRVNTSVCIVSNTIRRILAPQSVCNVACARVPWHTAATAHVPPFHTPVSPCLTIHQLITRVSWINDEYCWLIIKVSVTCLSHSRILRHCKSVNFIQFIRIPHLSESEWYSTSLIWVLLVVGQQIGITTRPADRNRLFFKSIDNL